MCLLPFRLCLSMQCRKAKKVLLSPVFTKGRSATWCISGGGGAPGGQSGVIPPYILVQSWRLLLPAVLRTRSSGGRSRSTSAFITGSWGISVVGSSIGVPKRWKVVNITEPWTTSNVKLKCALDIAVLLPIATSTQLTNLRQYINNVLLNLVYLDGEESLYPMSTGFSKPHFWTHC